MELNNDNGQCTLKNIDAHCKYYFKVVCLFKELDAGTEQCDFERYLQTSNGICKF